MSARPASLSGPQIQAKYQNALRKQKAGQLAKAKELYLEIVAARPAIAEAWYQIGAICRAEKNLAGALEALSRAARLRPKEPAVLDALAGVQLESDKQEEASETLRALLRLDPNQPRHYGNLGAALQVLGRTSEAEELLRSAIGRFPEDTQLYRILLRTTTLGAKDRLLPKMREIWERSADQETRPYPLGFALAKAAEDAGADTDVFTYLRPANEALSRMYPFNADLRQAEIDRLREAFEGLDLADPEPIKGAPDIDPIVIAGLPRSGTTLVEQILASHGSVGGAGEVPGRLRQAFALLGKPPAPLTPVTDLSDDALLGFATGYEEELRGLTEFDRVVTDKGMQNHMILGLFRRSLPQTRFVAVDRDPRDIGYSIYKNNFAEGTNRFASDMRWIARYMRTHKDMMDFWEEKMPGRIYHVQYETLVGDLETEARALVKAVGLPWDPACLAFHKNKRKVKTLSVNQVRQPVYASSTALWRRFEADLAPLIDALGEEGLLDGIE